MLRIYRMPNGRTYQFDEDNVPAGAVLVERPAEAKAEEPKENKAEKPKKNKARKPKGTK